jgi:hypothetical protein
MRPTLKPITMSVIAGAMVFGAPAANAQQEVPSLHVFPDRADSWQQVWLEAPANPCEGATPTSPALQFTAPLKHDPNKNIPGAVFGTALVRDVHPGVYPVVINCHGQWAGTAFTVLPG